ncbi:MAG: hypothetical protein ACKOEO_12795, partial [Planctomycetaceae bacterium]
EQCVRNVMIRKSYTPIRNHPVTSCGTAQDRFARDVAAGRFTLEELIENYVSMIYAAEDRHFGRASRRLNIDWRTLKQKLNQEQVESFSDR